MVKALIAANAYVDLRNTVPHRRRRTRTRVTPPHRRTRLGAACCEALGWCLVGAARGRAVGTHATHVTRTPRPAARACRFPPAHAASSPHRLPSDWGRVILLWRRYLSCPHAAVDGGGVRGQYPLLLTQQDSAQQHTQKLNCIEILNKLSKSKKSYKMKPTPSQLYEFHVIVWQH